MIKVIYSTEDILNEFLTRADMKGIEMEAINMTEQKILEDGFCLVRYFRQGPGLWGSVYICEWNEDGKKDSDEWVKSPDKFLYAVAENYIEDALKFKYE